MHAVLKQLGLEAVNDGTWFGHQSVADKSAPLIESYNPATNELIASVRATSMAQYEEVIAKAQESFLVWRAVPAPVRGEAVRRIGLALRKHKDALGSLVALENGKIKAEGDGEVQEMIDIADFAVGQSRMLYGRTMHLGTSAASHVRTMASARPARHDFQPTSPSAVWLPGTPAVAAVCGNVNIWGCRTARLCAP